LILVECILFSKHTKISYNVGDSNNDYSNANNDVDNDCRIISNYMMSA